MHAPLWLLIPTHCVLFALALAHSTLPLHTQTRGVLRLPAAPWSPTPCPHSRHKRHRTLIPTKFPIKKPPALSPSDLHNSADDLNTRRPAPTGLQITTQ